MTKILALDTATEACSAALWLEGTLTHCDEVAPQAHTRKILPMCQSLLQEGNLELSQLDAIAFGRGPGSFTGVRIGIGVALVAGDRAHVVEVLDAAERLVAARPELELLSARRGLHRSDD